SLSEERKVKTGPAKRVPPGKGPPRTHSPLTASVRGCSIPSIYNSYFIIHPSHEHFPPPLPHPLPTQPPPRFRRTRRPHSRLVAVPPRGPGRDQRLPGRPSRQPGRPDRLETKRLRR